MTNYKEIDLTTVIKDELAPLMVEEKQKLNKLQKIGAGLILLGTLISIVMMIVTLSIYDRDPKGGKLMMINLGFFFAVISAAIIILLISRPKKPKNIEEQINFAKYYQIQLENLFQTPLTNFKIDKNFQDSKMDLKNLNDNPKIISKDVISFEINGIQVSYGLATIKTGVQKDSKGNIIKKDTTQTFLVLKSNQKIVEGKLNIFLKTKSFLRNDGTSDILLEDDAFNKEIGIQSDSEVGARKFLAPKKMEALLKEKAEVNKIHFNYVFIQNDEFIAEALNNKADHIRCNLFTELPPLDAKGRLDFNVLQKVSTECWDLFNLINQSRDLGLIK